LRVTSRVGPRTGHSIAVILSEAKDSTDAFRASQVWFARAITTPESEPQPEGAGEAERRLVSGPRMNALERLEVYRRAYHRRLIECLADDYPALGHTLGFAAFDALCRAYIARHPSGGPSLNAYGRSMAEFCRSHPTPLPFPNRAFAADLASLEWAIVEVIHSAATERATLDGLNDVPLERWAAARLVPTPALRLLRFEYPVNAYFQAFADGERTSIPAPAASRAVVYRQGPKVWRMNLSEPMFAVLESLAAGTSLEASLERAAGSFAADDEGAAVRRVAGWFREWVASGLFARIDFA
jgi:hypothetical protein